MDYPKSVPNVGLVNGKFVDENTTTGQVGSLIPASWGNAVTSEILNVLKAASIVPDELSNDQLYKAISKIVAESGIAKEELNKKADKATTLAGYGITDGMLKGTGGIGLSTTAHVTDLNGIQATGMFRFGADAANRPPGAVFGTVDHVSYDQASGNWTQHAVGTSPRRSWIRSCINGAVQAWVEVWNTENFNPASKADASAVAQATEAARGTVMLAGFADVNAGDGFKAMTANMFMNFSLGFRQVWRDMLGSRAAGVGYLNSTGKPIMVSVISSTADRGLYIYVDGVVVSKQGQEGGTGSDFNCVQAIIPPGSTYAVGLLGGATISHWAELRA